MNELCPLLKRISGIDNGVCSLRKCTTSRVDYVRCGSFLRAGARLWA